MKYKRQELDQLFVIKFFSKSQEMRDEIMTDMTIEQLECLNKLVTEMTLDSIKEKPMIRFIEPKKASYN